jgi:hypothetical protein
LVSPASTIREREREGEGDEEGSQSRTRHEVELAAFYKRHKGGKGGLNWRDREGLTPEEETGE